ncbi:GNAT family N-acetyltransferase [Niallia circulans]|uniref:GNAT family N-acetyltransferase n=1 Tax=Niallia circulans TaxID=1397 RepID=A0A941GJ41_NIACI|nr:GNAT family N-acetyltransferase [Niallia circulans]MCB5239897.1 GNAT family N-acetyltransferase [Niallia circulans]
MLLKSLGKNIYIKQPEWKELAFVEWYRRMVQPTDKRNLYYLIYTYEDIPVGEVSFQRFDKEKGLAELNVKIAYKYRKKGYAKEAISLLLNYYFYEFNGEVMVDRVAKIIYQGKNF